MYIGILEEICQDKRLDEKAKEIIREYDNREKERLQREAKNGR